MILKYILAIFFLFSNTYETESGNILIHVSNVTFLLFTAWEVHKGKLRLPKASKLLMVFLTAMVCTSLLNIDYLQSGLVNTILQFTIFFAGFRLMGQKNIVFFTNALLIYGSITAVVAFYIYITGTENLFGLPIHHKQTEESERLFGWMVSGNRFGVVVGICTLLSFDKLFTNEGKWKRIFIVLTLFFVITLLYTGSRGSTISTGVGLAFYLYMNGAYKDLKVWVFYAPLAVIGGFLVFQTFISSFSALSIQDFYDTFFTREYTVEEDARFDFWATGIDAIKEMDLINLLLGNGNGSSILTFETSLHNSYLTVIIDYGLIALLLLITIIIKTFLLFIKHARQYKFGVVMSAIFVFVVLKSFTNTGILYTSFIGIMFMLTLAFAYKMDDMKEAPVR